MGANLESLGAGWSRFRNLGRPEPSPPTTSPREPQSKPPAGASSFAHSLRASPGSRDGRDQGSNAGNKLPHALTILTARRIWSCVASSVCARWIVGLFSFFSSRTSFLHVLLARRPNPGQWQLAELHIDRCLSDHPVLSRQKAHLDAAGLHLTFVPFWILADSQLLYKFSVINISALASHGTTYRRSLYGFEVRGSAM